MAPRIHQGSIPENITIITSGAEEVRTYDNLSRWWEDDEKATTISVVPAFISSADNEKTLETGRRWAKNRYSKKRTAVKEESRPNTPTKGVKLLNLEIRSEGGRAYKALLPSGHWVDLREDVLMDSILHSKIDKGVLAGSFIFGRHGSQMKLIRVGSALHTALLETTSRNQTAKIKNSDLIVGNRYRAKNEDSFVYMGLVDTVEYKVHDPYSYPRTPATITRHERPRHMLWFCIPSYLEKKYKAYWGEQIKKGVTYDLKITKQHSMIEDLGPAGIRACTIVNARQHCLVQAREAVTNIRSEHRVRSTDAQNRRFGGPPSENDVEQQVRQSLAHYAEFALMSPTGDNLEVPTLFRQLTDLYPVAEVTARP